MTIYKDAGQEDQFGMYSSDEDLVKAFISEDPYVVDVFVERFATRVYKVVKRFRLGEEDTEDCCQISISHILENLYKWKPQDNGKLSGWVASLTNNKTIDYIRHKNLITFISIDEGRESKGEKGDYNLIDILSADTSDPLVSMMDEDLYKQVKNSIMKLPEKYRDVLILHYYEGQSYEEIASFLNISIDTVATRLRRAKQRLKKSLVVYVCK